jgi:metal-responsive CopG/Arc/MetJ family transcriptional regulator
MDTIKSNTKQRVQFDFSQEALKRLDEMQERLGAPTKAEVVRNALKLYEWLINEIDPSSTIVIQDKEDKVQFRIPVKVLLA